ncbi:MAG: hypothetical protein K2X47_02275 [Bdellovibrionales bacterium]|nr:hypothetical protein [Bdellovibrionales bacterium]
MKSKISAVVFAISFLICQCGYGEGPRPALRTDCVKICERGILDRESCSCETKSNPQPGRRIWPDLDEASDDGVWDEDDEE